MKPAPKPPRFEICKHCSGNIIMKGTEILRECRHPTHRFTITPRGVIANVRCPCNLENLAYCLSKDWDMPVVRCCKHAELVNPFEVAVAWRNYLKRKEQKRLQFLWFEEADNFDRQQKAGEA